MLIVQILRILLFTVLPFATYAGTCIESAADYQRQKQSLPEQLQNLPVLLTTDFPLATAGLKIVASGSQLILVETVRKFSDAYTDEHKIKKLCYDQNKFRVTFENNKIFEVETSNDQLKILGFTFNRSTDAQYAAVVNKIQGQRGYRDLRTESSSGAL